VDPRNAEIFSVPRIISRTGKATNFKFCTHILSIDRNKSPLQISGRVAEGVVRTLEIFQGTRILGASRGRLCDSSDFLFFFCPYYYITYHNFCCIEVYMSFDALVRLGRES